MKKFLITFALVLTLATEITFAAYSAQNRMMELKASFPVMDNIPVTGTNPFSASLLVRGTYRMATHNRSSQRIFINEELFWSEMKSSMIHEAGHYVFEKFVPESQQWNYCKLFVRDGHSVSRYGKQDCLENFAEMFAYVNGSRYAMYNGLEEYLAESQQRIFVERITNNILNKSNR